MAPRQWWSRRSRRPDSALGAVQPRLGPEETHPIEPTLDLVTIPVSDRRWLAEMIVAAVRGEGIKCELLSSDLSGWVPEVARLQPHRILVHEDDRDRVQEIIDEFHTSEEE